MKKIKPPLGSIKILAEEFCVSRTMVDQALAFYSNSPTAQAIRARAVEMMKTELEETEEVINRVDQKI
ncbi:hypothetical protein QP519_09790 [Weeksella virosa]|uniref:hypothetical protein n=1 Tax=Weeksella virosa TaxID=1014 RepID=UPI002554838B|nr:hypothetical protein [Weeksella virosa]MDK7375826.1 hypothetical protein [Weeksella virosa]